MEKPEYYHEVKAHAKRDFPFNIYPCSIPADFGQVPVHWHEEMELIVIKKGEGIVTVDTHPFRVCGGEAVVVFPGQLHGISRWAANSVEYENVIFLPSMLMGSMDDVCTAKFLFPLVEEGRQAAVHITGETPEYEKFMECIGQLDWLCRDRPYGYQLAVKGALFEFLFRIFLHFREAAPGGGRKSREKIKALLRYIELHYGEELTVKEAAGICFYSKSYFMKFFRQHMGVTFVEYLNNYRLAMAASFLLSQDGQVTEVAQRCGFDNISYFNRLFKGRYGMAPGAYRKFRREEKGEDEPGRVVFTDQMC